MKNSFLRLAAVGVGVLVVSGFVAVLWTDSLDNDVKTFKGLAEEPEETDQVGDRSRKIDLSTADCPPPDRRPAFATDSEIEYASFVEFPDGRSRLNPSSV